jgi:hypothetical protein
MEAGRLDRLFLLCNRAGLAAPGQVLCPFSCDTIRKRCHSIRFS